MKEVASVFACWLGAARVSSLRRTKSTISAGTFDGEPVPKGGWGRIGWRAGPPWDLRAVYAGEQGERHVTVRAHGSASKAIFRSTA